MPVLHRLAAVALVLLPTSALGTPVAQAAPAGPSADAVSLVVDRSAWSWRRTLPTGLPVEEPSQVPPGGLAVAADADPEGRPAKATYLQLDLAAIPTATRVEALTLALPVDPSEDGRDAADVRLMACRLKAPFTPGSGVDPATMPAQDCSSPVVGAFDAEAKAWTFALASYAQGWLQDPGSNNGVVIRPPLDHVLPDGKPFQVNLVGAAQVRAELVGALPAPAPAPAPPPVSEAPPVEVGTVVPDALPPLSGGSAPLPQSPVAQPQPVAAAAPVAVAPVAAAVTGPRVLPPARSTTGALWSLAVLAGMLLVAVARVAGNTTGPAAFARLERQRLDRIRMAVPSLVAPELAPAGLPVHVPQRRHGRRPISSATSTVT